jgi:hypothetical protein
MMEIRPKYILSGKHRSRTCSIYCMIGFPNVTVWHLLLLNKTNNKG